MNPSTRKISVVIPLFNNVATIAACLQSVRSQTMADELKVIVVDDGSTDNGPNIARPLVDHLISQENLGPGAARNAGAKVATGEFVLFLDADCVAPPDWVEKTVSAMETADAAAALIMLSNSNPYPVSELIQLEIEERYRRVGGSTKVDFIAGAACACRRQDFNEVGGFDTRYRYNEDVEFSYRLNKLGKTIVLVHDLRVAHPHPARWKKYFLMKYNRGIWRMWLYRQYPAKSVSDSWTPQTLKLQVLTVFLFAAFSLTGLIWPTVFWLLIPTALLFLISAIGFVKACKAQSNSKNVVLLTLGLIVVRALALGSSVLAALVRTPPIALGRVKI